MASIRARQPVVYASLPGEPVAPGQLSVETVVGLKRLWREEAGRGVLPARRRTSPLALPGHDERCLPGAGIDAAYEAVSVKREEFPGRFLALKGGDKGHEPHDTLQVRRHPSSRLRSTRSRRGSERSTSSSRSGSKCFGLQHRRQRHHGPAEGTREGFGVRSALLLGAGGAARAFCEAMSQLRCAEITVVVRDTARGEGFVSEMARIFRRDQVLASLAIDQVGRTDARPDLQRDPHRLAERPSAGGAQAGYLWARDGLRRRVQTDEDRTC